MTEVEALPEALPGAVAPAAVGDGVDGGGERADDDALEEAPDGVGGEAEAADFVGGPDAEGASATGASVAVAAKDAASAAGFLPGMGFIVAVQMAVAIKSANGSAMGTRKVFELLGQGVPLLIVAAKAWDGAHDDARLP